MSLPESSSSMVDENKAFREYYARHLQPFEDQFEVLRKRAVTERNRRLMAATFSWCATILGVCYLAHPVGPFWPFFAFFGLVTAIGLGMWAWLPATSHTLRLQDQILTRIVPFFGDLQYRQEPDFQPSAYHDWMVLPYFTNCSSEDQITGSYRGVPLNLAELKLEYGRSHNSGTGGTTRRAFDGLMVIFELGISFPGVTLFRTRGSDMDGSFRLNETLKEIGADERFEAFATDDALGDQFPLTQYFEQFALVADRFNAKQLFASYHDRRLVLLIDQKRNFFEMSVRQQTDFSRDAERIRDELSDFFSIVDLLSLDIMAPESTATASGTKDATFPEIPTLAHLAGQDQYDIGGWGCLVGFLLLGGGIATHLVLLDDTLSHGARLGYSAIGGLLSAVGVYQVGRGIVGRSIAGTIWGLLLVAGAIALLVRHLPE